MNPEIREQRVAKSLLEVVRRMLWRVRRVFEDSTESDGLAHLNLGFSTQIFHTFQKASTIAHDSGFHIKNWG